MTASFLVHVGAVHWDHPAWRGSFYPEALPDDWTLSYYNTQFQAVFLPLDVWQRVPAEEWARWLHDTREDFTFVPGVFALINEAYRGLYSVVPLSDRQVEYYTKAFFGFIDHRFVKIVVDPSNQVAAFGIAIPSLSRALQRCRGRLLPFGVLHLLHGLRTSDRLDLLLTAVRPDLQNKGVNAVLINEVWKAAIARRMTLAETGPELETNERIQSQWRYFDSRLHRRRRCYVKAL